MANDSVIAGPGVGLGDGSGDHEDPGADDDAHAEDDEVQDAEVLLQPVLGLVGLGDRLLHGLGSEHIHAQQPMTNVAHSATRTAPGTATGSRRGRRRGLLRLRAVGAEDQLRGPVGQVLGAHPHLLLQHLVGVRARLAHGVQQRPQGRLAEPVGEVLAGPPGHRVVDAGVLVVERLVRREGRRCRPRPAATAAGAISRSSGASGRTETYSASPSLSQTGTWSSRSPSATWVSSCRISRSRSAPGRVEHPRVQHEPGGRDLVAVGSGPHRERDPVQLVGVVARQAVDRRQERRVGEGVDHDRAGTTRRARPPPRRPAPARPPRPRRRRSPTLASSKMPSTPAPARTLIGPASHGCGSTWWAASQSRSVVEASRNRPGCRGTGVKRNRSGVVTGRASYPSSCSRTSTTSQ